MTPAEGVGPCPPASHAGNRPVVRCGPTRRLARRQYWAATPARSFVPDDESMTNVIRPPAQEGIPSHPGGAAALALRAIQPCVTTLSHGHGPTQPVAVRPPSPCNGTALAATRGPRTTAPAGRPGGLPVPAGMRYRLRRPRPLEQKGTPGICLQACAAAVRPGQQVAAGGCQTCAGTVPAAAPARTISPYGNVIAAVDGAEDLNGSGGRSVPCAPARGRAPGARP